MRLPLRSSSEPRHDSRTKPSLTCFSLVFVAATLFCAVDVEKVAAQALASPATTPLPTADTSLRCLTYNIHHAEGVDGKLDLERIASVIRQSNADLVALQEVDQSVQRTGNVDQPDELARLTGMHVVFGGNIPLQGGHYGNAVLSRFPIVQQQNIPLPNLNQGEQRGVLDLVVSTPQGHLRILATHLDHRPNHQERIASIGKIAELVSQSPELPTLLLGDLNATWDSPPMQDARSIWHPSHDRELPTIPAAEPNRQIDYVLFQPADRFRVKTCDVIAEAVASDHRPLVAEIELLPRPWPAAEPTAWHGFTQYRLTIDDHPLTVVAPREAAPGRPWIWHGEFFGHRPEPDIALLERGFHAVYLSAPNLLGSPAAVKLWNETYATLTSQYGFSAKPALVGLSRGGLYCYNWASANPDRVACIYGDAPVCDFKSWPGGKGAGPGDKTNWGFVQKLWNFETESAALEYAGNPVDSLQPLAQAGVPLLHVFGDADEVVPWEENTGLIAERYPKLGGQIQLIRKPGIKHHPHGLNDPAPIVEFISKHAAVPAAVRASPHWSQTCDAHGVLHVAIHSPRQRTPTELRIVKPTHIESGLRYPIVYLLPVEAANGSRWGDCMNVVTSQHLADRHQVIFVAPTFSDLPWYANHPTDSQLQQETYFLEDVLPLVRWLLPEGRHDRDGRLLVGFSKSGYGAWSLLLRHPELFGRAVAWDAPLMLNEPGKYGSGDIYGTADNFASYELTKLIEKYALPTSAEASQPSTPRLIHLGYGNFRTEHEKMEARLKQLNVDHLYRDGPERKHHWESGWLPEAIELVAPASSSR